jgi:predicted anti-sigma-YlaC factor YlaD
MRLKEQMACWSVKNVLDLYVDSRLTPATKSRVEAHLSSCASCRDAAQALAPLKFSKCKIAPPPGLAASILRQHQNRGQVPDQAAFKWNLSPAQAAAFVYLAILTAGNIFPGPSHQGPPQRIESELE